MTTYTLKSDKTIDKWLFHEDYFTQETNFLPLSIQRELVRRLTTNTRNRIDPSELKQLNPIIEVKLANISAAYRNKQIRSKKASHDKRAIALKNTLKSISNERGYGDTPQEQAPKHSEFAQFMTEFRQKR
jgi:hypothetical protein